MSEVAWWGAVILGLVAFALALRALVMAHEAFRHAEGTRGELRALERVAMATRMRIGASGKPQVHGTACPVCGEKWHTVIWDGDKPMVTCGTCGDWTSYVPERRVK